MVIIFSYTSPGIWDSSSSLEMARGHLAAAHTLWPASADKFPVIWQSTGAFLGKCEFCFSHWNSGQQLGGGAAIPTGLRNRVWRAHVNCIYMYQHDKRHISSEAPRLLGWVRAMKVSCPSRLFCGESPQTAFHMRATSLTLSEYILILAPGPNRLLISD